MENIDTVTVHKVIIEDTISTLRRALEKGEITKIEFFFPEVEKAVTTLQEILNKEISQVRRVCVNANIYLSMQQM